MHELHTDYPMAPEHLTVSPDMLSDFCSEIKEKIGNAHKNSSPTCWTKPNTFAITEIGLVLIKIHRIISFDQKPWLKPWIDYCTERRKVARDEFKSDLAKLQANATFGKTIEQVRHRVDVRLICDPINWRRR